MTLQEELNGDPVMMAGHPAGICQPETSWDDSKPLMVILASCHGRPLLTYFNMKPEFRAGYNIVRLETGPILAKEESGEAVMSRPSMRRLLGETDVLVTYNMGARHGSFSLSNVRKMLKPGCNVVTFVAPNCSIFWPVSYTYCGVLSALHALDRGQTSDEIIRDFDAGTFDPVFKMRWRLEMGRIEDRDSTHDVKLCRFIERNHKTHKLFLAASHPSFITIAWLGSGIMQKLGHPADSEAQILALDPLIDAMGMWPETHYEWEHFGFRYPLLHPRTQVGGIEHYHSVIRNAEKFNAAGGYFTIPMD